METVGEDVARRADVRLREFGPEDRLALVEVLNAVDPERPTTVEEHRHDDEAFEGSRYVHRRFLAIAPETGAIAGEGEYFHMPWSFDPSRFGVWFAVHPGRQGCGIGGALYERVAQDLHAVGARELRTWTQESKPASVEFLRRRGFQEIMRSWESRLDLTKFESSTFADRWRLPEGIEVTTLAAELARDPASLERAYEMDCELSRDTPRHDPFTPPGLDMYRHHVLEGPRAVPDAHFLAMDAGEYVGVSNLERFEALPDVMNTGFTGVRPEYRGRGIAFGLKLRAIDYARRHGIREIRTGNSTLNAPMLGINERLGFVRQPTWISFGRELAP